MIRKAAIIAGVIFAVLSAFIALLRGLVVQDVCTGTGSLGNNFSRLCASDFTSYVWLFSGISFILLIGLIVLSTRQNIAPQSRYILIGIFIIYGVWLIAFSSVIWNAPFFTDRQYPPGVNPNCIECPLATATPAN